MRKVVLDTNCLLMSIPKIKKTYFFVFNDNGKINPRLRFLKQQIQYVQQIQPRLTPMSILTGDFLKDNNSAFNPFH